MLIRQRRKKERRRRLGNFIFYFFIIVGMFAIGYGTRLIQERVPFPLLSESYTVSSGEQDIIERCSGRDLFKTSECLVMSVKTFYKYAVTDDNTDLTFSELKARGGDCRDWSMLYEKLGNALGFESTLHYVDKEGDGTRDHVFTILSNEEGYCVLDQREFWCIRLVEEDN